jgi:ATPase subunit of ABC transporter with duplicated ATPase domains
LARKSRTLKEFRDPMAAQYSFVMKGLTKAFPGQKPILNNIHLQFYPDAKIGIVGPNGSGKSTLMKIMAQRDKEFTGEAWPGEGITVGYLEQEPQLDPNKTVRENVMDGVRPVADMHERFNAISAQMADPGDDFDALMAEMDRTYPGYLFAEHKGYPTPRHCQLLKELGATPIHRRSFAPVREVLGLGPAQQDLFDVTPRES